MRWGVLILLGLLFVSLAGAEIPGDCKDSMIAYWQFEGDVLDSYGSHDGGVWTGTARYGDPPNGAVFEGAEKITIPNAADLNFDSAFTIEMWIKSEMSLGGDLFDKGELNIGWVFSMPPTGNIEVTIGSAVLSSAPIFQNTYHHIAVAWDSSGAKLKLYVDGSKVDETGLSSAANTAGNLILGDGFKGLIDELAIYDTDLSESIVRSHYNLGNAGKDYCDVSGAGGTSQTEAVFNIQGCSFEVGSKTIGVAKGECSVDGEYFCSDDKEDFVTGLEGLGCAMGDSGYDSANNDPYCCPPGSFCNETSAGSDVFKCDFRTVNCTSFDGNEADCKNNDCVWLDITDECVDMPRDYSCGYYDNESVCNADEWNLGKIGVGTELCGTTMECNGTTFSVPESECACAWYDLAPEGQKCQVKFVGVQMFYTPGGTPDRFQCSNTYELGDCSEGVQNVNWSSNSTVIDGFGGASAVPEDCLANLNCNGGATERGCGEPLIRVPGFSLFSLIASVVILISVYAFKLNRKH